MSSDENINQTKNLWLEVKVSGNSENDTRSQCSMNSSNDLIEISQPSLNCNRSVKNHGGTKNCNDTKFAEEQGEKEEKEEKEEEEEEEENDDDGQDAVEELDEEEEEYGEEYDDDYESPGYKEKVAKKQELFDLLNVRMEFKVGDEMYLISKQYIDELYRNTAETFEDLKRYLGKINTEAILKRDGTLCSTSDPNHIELFPISETAWNKCVGWFGLRGPPIKRYFIKDPETGFMDLEYYPPVFHIHTLTINKKNSINKNSVHYTNNNYPATLLVSKQAQVQSLIDKIKSKLRVKNDAIRVWVINSQNVDNLPTNMNLNQIDALHLSKLINQYDCENTLSEANLASGAHLLIEINEKSTKTFPLDDFKRLTTSSGCVGLSNLGNTCYMNSALQCLVHVPEIAQYFLFNVFSKELNESNPLGMHGKVAIAFGNLIHQLFGVQRDHQSHISPKEFKNTIGTYGPMFADYHQQDSQEFLAFLLDGLHEDLNRILTKPYTEKPELPDDKVSDPKAIQDLAERCWEQHKLRNDSLIVDLFVGLYKSTLICPNCNKISITFDPFSDLTLPLPVEKKWYHKILFFGESGYPKSLEVELNKNSNFRDLKKYVSKKLDIPVNELYVYEIFNNRFYKNFQTESQDYLPINEMIQKDDMIIFYHLRFSSDDLVVPVFQTVTDVDKNFVKPFAYPFFIILKESETYSFGSIRTKIEERINQFSTYNYFSQVRKQSKPIHTIEDFPLLAKDYEASDSDSDISLANPDLSGSFAFDIKIVKENIISKRYNQEDDIETSLYVPFLVQSTFKNLPNLIDSLPPKKKRFYNYDNLTNLDKQLDERVDDVVIATGETVEQLNIELNQVLSNNHISIDSDSGDEFSNIFPLFKSAENLKGSSRINSPVPQNNKEFDATPDKTIDAIDESPIEIDDASIEIDYKEIKQKSIPEPLVVHKIALVCQWNSDLFDTFFAGTEDEGEGGKETWSSPEVIPNIELEHNKKYLANKSKTNLKLEDCLQLFSKPEVLGEKDLWYCPNCKEHRQASKQIEIWKTPDILTIHLKRFESQRSLSDKIDITVDFPINGLDMSKHVVNDDGGELVYDLIAVDNHYGGIGGGHYTAYVKNFVDNTWHEFNDSRVAVANPEKAITGAAYLLFYRKRTDDILGSEKLREMIHEGREIWNNQMSFLDQEYENIVSEVGRFKKVEDEEEQRLKNSIQEINDNSEVIDVDGPENESEIEPSTKPSQDPKQFIKIDTSGIPFEELTVKVSGGRSSSMDGDYDDNNNARRKQRLISRISKSNFNERDSENASLVSSPVSETFEYLSSSVSGAVPVNTNNDDSVCPSPFAE